MNNKKWYWVVALVMIFGMLFSACQSSTPAAETTEPAKAEEVTEAATNALSKEAPKVALLLPGSANDQSWNQLGYEALMKVKEELGAEVAYSENVGTTDAVDAMRDYAGRGFDVIFGHGGQYEEAALQVGPDFPKTHFIIIAGAKGGGDNVTAVDTAPWQYGYAYGYMAAKASKTGTVGYITALEGVPTMNNLVGGWRLGVKKANPDVHACVVYLKDMGDVAGAREAALAMVEKGADVIQHELNRGTQGVIDVAKEKGVYTVGRSQENIDFAPEEIMTVTIFDWGSKYAPLVTQALNGELPGGAYFFGFHTPENPGFTFYYDDQHAWNPNFASDEILADFQKDVVDFFIAEPMMDLTVEDAFSGCD